MTRRWLSSGRGALPVAGLLLLTISAVLPVSPAAASVRDSSEQETQERAQGEKSRKRRTIPVVMVAPGTGSGSNTTSRPGAPTRATTVVAGSEAMTPKVMASGSTSGRPQGAAVEQGAPIESPAPPVPDQPQTTTSPRLVSGNSALRGVQAYLAEVEGSAPATTDGAQRAVGATGMNGSQGVAAMTASPTTVPPAVGNGAPRAAAAAEGSAEDYRLGPGDVVHVFVWRNDQLSREVPVRPDGRISLPLAGEITAAGKTALELQYEIVSALGEFIQVPTVTVTITQIRSLIVYVLGNVRTPGPLQLDHNITALQAIAMAGGLNEFADKNDITILRSINGVQQRFEFRYGDAVKGKSSQPEIELRAGDVIVVP